MQLLTNNQISLVYEIVRWDLEIQRSRAFSYTARDVVVRTVARTEPAAEIAGFADGDTSEMCADSCCNLLVSVWGRAK